MSSYPRQNNALHRLASARSFRRNTREEMQPAQQYAELQGKSPEKSTSRARGKEEREIAHSLLQSTFEDTGKGKKKSPRKKARGQEEAELRNLLQSSSSEVRGKEEEKLVQTLPVSSSSVDESEQVTKPRPNPKPKSAAKPSDNESSSQSSESQKEACKEPVTADCDVELLRRFQARGGVGAKLERFVNDVEYKSRVSLKRCGTLENHAPQVADVTPEKRYRLRDSTRQARNTATNASVTSKTEEVKANAVKPKRRQLWNRDKEIFINSRYRLRDSTRQARNTATNASVTSKTEEVKANAVKPKRRQLWNRDKEIFINSRYRLRDSTRQARNTATNASVTSKTEEVKANAVKPKRRQLWNRDKEIFINSRYRLRDSTRQARNTATNASVTSKTEEVKANAVKPKRRQLWNRDKEIFINSRYRLRDSTRQARNTATNASVTSKTEEVKANAVKPKRRQLWNRDKEIFINSRYRLRDSTRQARNTATNASVTSKTEEVKANAVKPKRRQLWNRDTEIFINSRSSRSRKLNLKPQQIHRPARESSRDTRKKDAVGTKNTDNISKKKTKHKSRFIKPVKFKKSSVAKRLKYTSLEDHTIVAWLSVDNRERLVNGSAIWKELQGDYPKLTKQNRTWNSLRNRYLRYILPSLVHPALPPAQVSCLRDPAAQAEADWRQRTLEAEKLQTAIEAHLLGLRTRGTLKPILKRRNSMFVVSTTTPRRVRFQSVSEGPAKETAPSPRRRRPSAPDATAPSPPPPPPPPPPPRAPRPRTRSTGSTSDWTW